MISKTIGVILIAATVAAGVYFDIGWLLVGGIEEFIRGVQAHPASGHDIGWGIAHVVFTGFGIFVAAMLCVLWAAVFLGRSKPARRTARR